MEFARDIEFRLEAVNAGSAIIQEKVKRISPNNEIEKVLVSNMAQELNSLMEELKIVNKKYAAVMKAINEYELFRNANWN